MSRSRPSAREPFNSTASPGSTEMSFAEAFHSEGFETLDPFVLRARYTQPQLIDVLRTGSAKAARMARENRADVILMGSAHFSESSLNSVCLWKALL